MKKIILILAVLIMLMSISCCASAETVNSGTLVDMVSNEYDLKWTYDNQGTLTISGSGMIPCCTSDEPAWSTYSAYITKIVIQNGITGIDMQAFSSYAGLSSVELPSSLKEIGFLAFRGCTNLKTVYYAGSIADWCGIDFGRSYILENAVYFYCAGEQVVAPVIPEGVTVINSWAFDGYKGLQSVTLPATVTDMASAFSECTNLKTVYYTGSVTDWYNKISDYGSVLMNADSFYCDGKLITSAVLPDGITAIKDAFRGYKGLTSVEIPSSVKEVGLNAFYKCTGLTSVKLPSTVTTIGASAFSGCTGLTSINIPSSVTGIGNYAFYGCTSLAAIDLTSSITQISQSTFECCTGLSSVTIPMTVTAIREAAFKDCSGLTSIEIPVSVTTIADNIFGSEHTITVYYEGNKSEWNQVKAGAGSSNSWWSDKVICKGVEETFIVTYDVNTNGGTGENFTREVTSGSNADLSKPDVTLGEGYSFVGWSLSPQSTKTIDSHVVTGDVTLYAVRRRTCNVSLISENNTEQKKLTVLIYNTDTSSSVTLPAATGTVDTCAGWREDAEPLEAQYAEKATITVSQNKKLYAVYTRKLTVSYNANGGTGAPSNQTFTQYVSGSGNAAKVKVTLGEAPACVGKFFVAWAMNGVEGQHYSTGTLLELTASATFYAVWEEPVITAPKVETGEAGSITETGAVLNGSVTDNGGDSALSYAFVYYPQSSSSAKTTVTADSSFSAILTGLNADTVYCYYAKAANSAGEGCGAVKTFTTAKQKTFTVSYNANGGVVSETGKTVTYGGTYGTLPTPAYTGHTFAGWYTSASGGTQITSSSTVSITSNQTLYAHWTTNITYTVSFDPNGGTGSPSAQTKEQGVSLTLSSYKPAKSYVIRYNANGGSVSPASKSVACTFSNWNTSKDGKGTSYASSGSYTANADVTLYAQWKDPAAGTLATPARSGCTFEGWFTSATGGSQITESSTITATTTVYAHWYDPYNMGDESYSFDNFGDSDSPYGHCFGMSITSAAYHNGILDISKIGGNANTPLYSFSKTSTVKRPICYYQQIQGSYSSQSIVAGGSTYLYGWSNIASDWEEVVSYVSSHKYDDTGLLQIGYRKNNQGGHAINFLRYENVNGQDRIYAYDNNFPEQETYFYQDSSGRVYQVPQQTFYGSIDCIALRDVKKYFSIAGNFDGTHALYMSKDAAVVQGYTYSIIDGNLGDEEYVMYEIPADKNMVKIIPQRDNADFIYMDTEYSFGEITDGMYGTLEFASMKEGAVTQEAVFSIFNTDSEFGDPDFALPSSLTAIEESAFEGIKAKVVFVPDTCVSIGAYAFRNTTLEQIRIPSGCTIADTAFENCGAIQIFGKIGSPAESFCETHDNCTFIEEK